MVLPTMTDSSREAKMSDFYAAGREANEEKEESPTEVKDAQQQQNAFFATLDPVELDESTGVKISAQEAASTTATTTTMADGNTTTAPSVPLYDKVEQLLYGMNKFKVDYRAAFVLAKENAQDPVMVAVQALLQVDMSISTVLWQKSSDLGLLSVANEGHGFAQAMAGCMMEHTVSGVHYHGEGWYEKGANNENATAQYFLGKSFEDVQDPDSAVFWYERAAFSGHCSAQVSLARLLMNVPTGDKEISAKTWSEAAASQSDIEGISSAAFLCHKTGELSMAESWRKRAQEEEKSLRAFLESSDYEHTGRGVMQDAAQVKFGELFQKQRGPESSIERSSSLATSSTTGSDKKQPKTYSKMRLIGLSAVNQNTAKATGSGQVSQISDVQATMNLMNIDTMTSIQLPSIGTMTSLTQTLLEHQHLLEEHDAHAMNADEGALNDQEYEKLSAASLPRNCHNSAGQGGQLFPVDEGMAQSSDADASESIFFPDSLLDGKPHASTETHISDVHKVVAPDIIRSYHAVLGYRAGRGRRLTAGTRELRETKDWYREHKEEYQRRGCQSQLFDDAMERYFQKMANSHADFPRDRASRERTILIHCSKPAVSSNRVQKPNCFRYEEDSEHQFGIAKFLEAVLFYFRAGDPPRLDDQVRRYRDKLQALMRSTGSTFEYFQSYLSFCEMTLQKAEEGDENAQIALERNNFLPTLTALWDNLDPNKRVG